MGRAIPVRQGYLHKKSLKSLNKDWRKKYVTLTSGTLTYHASLREYMNNAGRGKELSLRHSSVKVPATDAGDSGTHFTLVSLDGKEWRFDADSAAERALWVSAIEQQILAALMRSGACDVAARVRRVAGNEACADCGCADPEWAAVNVAVVVCIECSGIHRNLGTHISKVRSLLLDDWPPAHAALLLALGNRAANAVWEAGAGGRPRPRPASPRDDKERWIRAKYEARELLRPLPPRASPAALLAEAVARGDVAGALLALAHGPVPPAAATRALVSAAASSHSQSLALVQLLLWHGADARARADDGRCAADVAVDDDVRALLARAAPSSDASTATHY